MRLKSILLRASLAQHASSASNLMNIGRTLPRAAKRGASRDREPMAIQLLFFLGKRGSLHGLKAQVWLHRAMHLCKLPNTPTSGDGANHPRGKTGRSDLWIFCRTLPSLSAVDTFGVVILPDFSNVRSHCRLSRAETRITRSADLASVLNECPIKDSMPIYLSSCTPSLSNSFSLR